MTHIADYFTKLFYKNRKVSRTQCFRGGDKYYFYNPVMQNTTHCEALAKVLRTVPQNDCSFSA